MTKEQRIEHYAAMVAQGHRLFEPGERARDSVRVCVGCGKLCPNQGGPMPGSWHVQPFANCPRYREEIHCPECVKEWGWGDGLCSPNWQPHRN